MRKRSKHTQYYRPTIAKRRGNWVGITVSLVLLFLSGAMIYMVEMNPPEQLLSVSGVVEGRTPIYSRDKSLNGFRFCVGKPSITFTYLQPDPRVDETLAAVSRAASVTVLYATHAHRNPTLWGLAADGRTLTTTEELRDARSLELMAWVLGFVVSGAVALHLIARAVRERRRNARVDTRKCQDEQFQSALVSPRRVDSGHYNKVCNRPEADIRLARSVTTRHDRKTNGEGSFRFGC